MEITEVYAIIKVRMTVFRSSCRDLTGSKLVTHPFQIQAIRNHMHAWTLASFPGSAHTLFQQATESWVWPGNEATWTLC